MKYTITNLALKTFGIAVISFAALVTNIQAQTVLQQWNFNDASGTAMNATANSVIGGASWSGPVVGVTTTGSGTLLNAYTNEVASTRITAPIATVSTGIVQFDVTLSGWDITGYNQTAANLSPLFRLGLASSSTSTLVANLWFSATPTGVTLSGVGPFAVNDTPAAQTQSIGALSRNTPITLRLTADFDARTYSISNSDTGFAVLANGVLPATNASFLNFRVLNNFSTAGSGVFVDNITFSSIPEPTTVALHGLAAGVFIYRFKSRKLKGLS